MYIHMDAKIEIQAGQGSLSFAWASVHLLRRFSKTLNSKIPLAQAGSGLGGLRQLISPDGLGVVPGGSTYCTVCACFQDTGSAMDLLLALAPTLGKAFAGTINPSSLLDLTYERVSLHPTFGSISFLWNENTRHDAPLASDGSLGRKR